MRHSGWEAAFAARIEDTKHTPFEWGKNDCILWAGGCAEAITGRNYLSNIKGRYKTKRGAYRLIKSLAPSLPEAVDLYASRIPVLTATRGDVVWNGEGMGVCNGVYSLFLTEAGLVSLKTKECSIAWRIE
jgi:hypothetical protein